MNDIDFSRSFVRFATTRVRHTPRLLLDAVCTLRDGEGARTYYLSCPCIGEEMYRATGLIHSPAQEFHIVLAPEEQYLVLKRCPSAADDLRTARRMGDPMPTHSGTPATVVELAAQVARHAAMSPVADYDTFRRALLDGRPVNGRTTWRTDGLEVTMDYPARTINAGTQEPVWQVDAGPVLIPSEPGDGALEVSRFGLAYLVYNRWDYAEAAVREATPLDPAAPDGPRTAHFSRLLALECRNELWAVGG